MTDAAAVRRGDVWWVSLDGAANDHQKMRAAVVLTADGLNRARGSIVVVPLSVEVEVRPPIVVATPSVGQGTVAVCDQLRAIDKGLLVEVIGRLANGDLKAVQDGVRTVLQL
ncbi:type II toxin-antitoxin system PemK/MazF family toxin [Telmatospirillum siberiense]|uniref:type II toxin-antitoxin system PemK/MazF family toxin n=1 Tax=Telmatospirillum siberiense TaxID=382514 RepID=UPI0018EC8422|nr:type II toxin-antitoxin system PemK/MazF family toxin [Telmatospirillum siberiense]